MDVDLPAYFARIGYAPPTREPTLALLRELQLRHLSHIAFEGLDPFLGVPVNLDPDAIWRKLIHSRRGGYCQEQNALFHEVLAALGYAVSPLGARVLLTGSGEPGQQTLTHRLTLVEFDEGRFIADVGFGGQTPAAPLRLEPGLEQATPFGTCRLTRDGDSFDLETNQGGLWRGLYRFNLVPPSQADFEVANWYTSTHPRSSFIRNLIASRVIGDARFNLLNADLAVRHADGAVEHRTLTSARELEELLDAAMGLSLPVPADTIWAKLERA